MTIFLIVLGVIATLLIVAIVGHFRRLSRMSPEESQAYLEQLQERQRVLQEEQQVLQIGQKNPAMICPHCQTKGAVRVKRVDRKKGISGGKATAALLTGGVSMLATGLSRKEEWTHAKCENCASEWDF